LGDRGLITSYQLSVISKKTPIKRGKKMYQNINTHDAIAQLMDDELANWSWDGAKALIEYFEELEGSIDKPLELDTVAIRCDFSEYDSVIEAAEHYDFILDDSIPPDDEDEIEAAALQYLEDRTTVIQFKGGVIIQQF
jgi:hypothetical protein